MSCENQVSAILGVPLVAPWDHLVRLLCEAGLLPMEATGVLALCYFERPDSAAGSSAIGALSRAVSGGDREIGALLLRRATREMQAGAKALQQTEWMVLLRQIRIAGLSTQHCALYMFREYMTGRLTVSSVEQCIRTYRETFSTYD